MPTLYNINKFLVKKLFDTYQVYAVASSVQSHAVKRKLPASHVTTATQQM